VPGAPASEEYLDSEKYQVRARDWDAPGNLVDFISSVNTIRRKNPALQRYRNLTFYPSESPHILWYGKTTEDLANVIFVAANLDPTVERESMVDVPIAELGIAPHEIYKM